MGPEDNDSAFQCAGCFEYEQERMRQTAEVIELRRAVAVCLEHFRDELAMGIAVCVPQLTEKYSELLIMCAGALGRPTMADLDRFKNEAGGDDE